MSYLTDYLINKGESFKAKKEEESSLMKDTMLPFVNQAIKNDTARSAEREALISATKGVGSVLPSPTQDTVNNFINNAKKIYVDKANNIASSIVDFSRNMEELPTHNEEGSFPWYWETASRKAWGGIADTIEHTQQLGEDYYKASQIKDDKTRLASTSIVLGKTLLGASALPFSTALTGVDTPFEAFGLPEPEKGFEKIWEVAGWLTGNMKDFHREALGRQYVEDVKKHKELYGEMENDELLDNLTKDYKQDLRLNNEVWDLGQDLVGIFITGRIAKHLKTGTAKAGEIWTGEKLVKLRPLIEEGMRLHESIAKGEKPATPSKAFQAINELAMDLKKGEKIKGEIINGEPVVRVKGTGVKDIITGKKTEFVKWAKQTIKDWFPKEAHTEKMTQLLKAKSNSKSYDLANEALGWSPGESRFVYYGGLKPKGARPGIDVPAPLPDTVPTTKILEDLKGRDTVSKQFIQDLTNQPQVKQVERDMIRGFLDEYEGGKINVTEFENKVRTALLPLEEVLSKVQTNRGEYNFDRYENITLPDETRGEIENYYETVYGSPIQTSAGQIHFGQDIENYFAHTRIEDVPGDTRRIIELQSDLFQKGRLEGEQFSKNAEAIREIEKLEKKDFFIFENEAQAILTKFNADPDRVNIESLFEGKGLRSGSNDVKAEQQLQPYRNIWYERIIREEIKGAAQDGKQTVLFPTGETAMKIEGLGDTTTWSVVHDSGKITGFPLKELMDMGEYEGAKYAPGQIIRRDGNIGDEWVITEVLDNGRFKAEFKKKYDEQFETWQMTKGRTGKNEQELLEDINNFAETFDISGKVDTSNPIYKFYEKDVAKYLNKEYGIKQITDEQGVTWNKVEMTPKLTDKVLKSPVMAFMRGPEGDASQRPGIEKVAVIEDMDLKTSREYEESTRKIEELSGEIEAVDEGLKQFDREDLNVIRKLNRILEKTTGDIETLRKIPESPIGKGYSEKKVAKIEKEIAEAKAMRDFANTTIERVTEVLGIDEAEAINFIEEIPTRRQVAALRSERRMTSVKASKLKKRIDRMQTIRNITDKQKAAQKIKSEIIKSAKDIPLRERGKLLATIKNAKTGKDYKRAVDKVGELQEFAEKKRLEKQIKRELKYTKPIKKGQKRVAKYDYESNKVIEKLRDINRFSKEKAQEVLKLSPTENLSEFDKMKIRMLSLKANGAKSSLALVEKVLDDIKTIKMSGKMTKNVDDLIKKIEKRQKVDELLENMELQKPSLPVLKQLKTAYVSSISNLYSALNAIAGKKIADQYDYGRLQTKTQNDFGEKVEKIVAKTKQIYNLKSDWELNKKLINDLASPDYKITDSIGTIEINKLSLMDIYNAIKNDLIKDRYYNTFGEEQVTALLQNLSIEDAKLADTLMEEAQGYRDVLNQRSVEITGRDLGVVENYWPSTSKYKADFYDDIRIQGETPSAMKERAKSSSVKPVPDNAWLKLQKHIAEAEHVKTVSRKYEELQNLFTNEAVERKIKEKYGIEVYYTLMEHIDTFSLNYRTQRLDVFSGVMNKALNNWVKAKIGSPTVFVRQLISSVYSTRKVGIKNYLKYNKDFIKNPKGTFDYMWNNVPYIRSRFKQGYSEALQEVIRGADKLKVGMGSLTKYLTLLTRSGDVTAIMINGYPIIKDEMSKHGDIKKASEELEKFTEKTQQSGSSANLSSPQRAKGFFHRVFFRFKNTTNQLLRLQTDSTIQALNKQITPKEFAADTVLYSIYTPIMYVLAGIAVKELWQMITGAEVEEEESTVAGDILQNILVQPFQALPLLDAAAENAYAEIRKKLTGKDYYYGEGLFSYPLFDDVSKAWTKAKKKEKDASDWLSIMSLLQEPVTGIPTETLLRYYKYARPEQASSKKKKTFSF
jgi:hypothetical protein